MKKTLLKLAISALTLGIISPNLAHANEPLNLGHQPYSHALPVYVADKEGKFEELGYDANILMFTSGPSQNEAMGAGEWSIGALGTPGALSGAIAYDSKIIGVSVDDSVSVDFYARPDDEIVTSGTHVEGNEGILGDAESWRGKTIIIPTATNIHLYLMVILEDLGLTQEDVNIVHMEVAQAYTAFQAGEGDIVGLWDPQSYFAEDDQDWVKVASSDVTGVKVPTVIVATEDTVNNHPEMIMDFLRVYFETSDELMADITLQEELLLEMQLDSGLTTDEKTAKRFVEDRPLPTIQDNVEWFTAAEGGQSPLEESIILAMEFFISQGSYTQEDLDRLIENSFIDGSFIMQLAEETE